MRSGLIDLLLPGSEGMGFVPVAIERSGSLELLLGDVTIRAGADVPASRLAEVVRAVRSA